MRALAGKREQLSQDATRSLIKNMMLCLPHLSLMLFDSAKLFLFLWNQKTHPTIRKIDPKCGQGTN